MPTTDDAIAMVNNAGWSVEDLRQPRGPAPLWRGHIWHATIRSPGGWRVESGAGPSAAAALLAAHAEIAGPPPMPVADDLEELLG